MQAEGHDRELKFFFGITKAVTDLLSGVSDICHVFILQVESRQVSCP